MSSFFSKKSADAPAAKVITVSKPIPLTLNTTQEEPKKDTEEEKKADADDKKSQASQSQSDEESDQAEPLNEDDPLQFSQEAQDWAMRALGDITYAKYFELARGRSDEDAAEMLRKRSWSVKLSRLGFENQMDPADIFLTFSFGYDFKVTRKVLRVKEETPQVKGGDTAPGKPKQKWTWVTKGGFGIVSMTRVCLNVSKGATCEFLDSFDFTWTGSYFDLYKKSLHIEVWDWNSLSPNKFLAGVEKPLRDVVLDQMDQQWQILTAKRKRGKITLEQDGQVQFQIIFQEILNYTVRLSNWSATVNPFLFLDELEEGADPVDVLPTATFCLHSPALPPWSKQRTRAAKLPKYKVEPKQQWLKVDLGQLHPLAFRGTRTDFEAGLLYVTLRDRGSLVARGELMGRAAIPLKSVLETGTLSSALSLPRKESWGIGETLVGPQTRAWAAMAAHEVSSLGQSLSRLLTRITGRVPAKPKPKPPAPTSEVARNAGFVSGSLNVDVLVRPSPIDRLLGFALASARLWREFAQVGEPNPPELRDYPPFNYSYLCVKLVQGRNLIACDPNGLSDPYVTVQWGDQRLRSRVIPETLDPVFNEDFYFLVRSFNPSQPTAMELAINPVVEILVWDHDDSGSSELMGKAHIFLHEITGCGAGGDPVTRPTTRINIKKRAFPGAALKTVPIATRVLKKTLVLEGLPRGLESTLSIECYFRGPRGDLHEADAWTRDRTGSELVVLPPLNAVLDDLLTTCLCEPVPRFARADEMRAPRVDARGAAALERKMCDAARGRGLCDKLVRFKQRLGQCSEKARALVKSFCSQLECDDFMARDQFGRHHFLPQFLQPITPPRSTIFPEEALFMQIRSSQKPNSSFLAAQMVRAIEFCDLERAKTVLFTENSWLAPDLFLTMRKGDVKAHALLLCSVLLGLMTDAYVCLGFARPEPAYELVLQIRERARKESWSSAKKRAAFAALRGEPRPYVWVMTRESTSEMYGPRFRGLAHFGGAVKFWDAARGAYYPPLPNRWEGQVGWRGGSADSRPQDDAALLARAQRAETKKVGVRLLLRLTRDQAKHRPPPKEPSRPPPPPAVEPPLAILEEDLLEGRQPVMVDVDDVFALDAGTGDQWGERAEAGSEEEEVEDEPQASSEGQSEAYASRMRFIKGHKQREREGRIREQMPFTKLVAVFNHRNLWVNVQKHAGPCDMAFDFEQGLAGGWLPVLTEHEAAIVQAFYPARNLGPKLTEDRVASLRYHIAEELEAGLFNMRASHNVATRMAGRDMNALVTRLVEAKHETESVDKSRANGWQEGEWEPDSEGHARDALYRALLRAVLRSIPPGFKFRLGFAKLNTVDPIEVRQAVLGHTWREPGAAWVDDVLQGKDRDPLQAGRRSIHEEDHNGREMFAMGVNVVPFVNQTSMVRVCLVCVFPAGQ